MSVARLCDNVAARWGTWDGVLALQSVDPRSWTLTRPLNAAEVAMYQAAEDDTERARIRARLHSLPPSQRPADRKPVTGGLPASALLAQVAAEDAALAAMRQSGRAHGSSQAGLRRTFLDLLVHFLPSTVPYTPASHVLGKT